MADRRTRSRRRSPAGAPDSSTAPSDAHGDSARFQSSRSSPTPRARRLYESLAAPVFSGPDAARREHEAPRLGQTDRAEAPHRHEGERGQVTRKGREDRRMILASAVRADAGIPLERPERPAVLDARVVAGGVERLRMFACHSGRASISGDAHERGRQADDERARTAHARRPRQVAREGHLGGERGAWKVSREPPDDDFDVVAPARVPIRGHVPGRIGVVQRHALLLPRVDDVDRARPAARRESQAARHGAHEAASARVVGVLAEDLEPARHPRDILPA